MDDGCAHLLGHALGEQRTHRLHFGNLVGFRRHPLFGPAADLPRQIGFLAAEVTQSDGIRIDLVQVRQHVDDMQPERMPIIATHP